MRAVNLVALVAFGVAVFDGAVAALAQAPTATAYEGARLIMGDGRAPIENATIVVLGDKIVQVVGSGIAVPQGATHVNLAGKTVIPALIDTHTHLSDTKELLALDLKRRAYYGVSATQSMLTSVRSKSRISSIE